MNFVPMAGLRMAFVRTLYKFPPTELLLHFGIAWSGVALRAFRWCRLPITSCDRAIRTQVLTSVSLDITNGHVDGEIRGAASFSDRPALARSPAIPSSH